MSDVFPVSPERLLTIEQAQAVLPMSRAWFAQQRWRKSGPTYVKVGSRILYRCADLLEFAQQRMVKPEAV
jgi:hypothetical protein